MECKISNFWLAVRDFVEIWIKVTLRGGLIFEKFISSSSSSTITYPLGGVQILREQNTYN